MKNKNTLTEVGMACHYLENIKKHKEQFEKYPNSSFYLRNNMNGDCMDIKVVLKNTKTELCVCQKLKETVIKNHNDWSVVR